MRALARNLFPAYRSPMNRIAIALQSVRRESANGMGYALRWFWLRFYLRMIRRRWPGLPASTAADLARPLTIVIPSTEKDAAILEHCLQSVRETVANPIAAIWVVAPESERIRALAAAHQAQFVHEDKILPRPAFELKTRGWLLQQFIKLNAANFVETNDYLVLDSDTLFLRPQYFFRGGRTVLRYSDQYELLYNRSLSLIFGHTRRFPVSFVTHHSVFERSAIQSLLAALEQRLQLPWWKAILEVIDRGHSHMISFAEYELYGHFITDQPDWKKRFVLEYWNGLDLEGPDIASLDTLRREVGPHCNSLSFHRHTQ